MYEAPPEAEVEPANQFIYLKKCIKLTENGRKVEMQTTEGGTPLKTMLVQYLGHAHQRRGVLGPTCRHFSVTVDDMDSLHYTMVGLTRRCWPGRPLWDVSHAVRYHSNDGGVFNGGPTARSLVTFTKGDKVVCRAAFLGRYQCLVEYVKNGEYVFRTWVQLPATELYATVGFNNAAASLTVDWPAGDKEDEGTVSMESPSNWLATDEVERDDATGMARVKGDEGPIGNASKALCMQSPRPFLPDFTYLEVKVIKIGDEGSVAVGLVPPSHSRTDLPGWGRPSLGYHSDDGGLHRDGKMVEGDAGKQYGVDDVVGCGIVMFGQLTTSQETEKNQANMATVIFTRNGVLQHSVTCRQPLGGWYPCVGFMGKGTSVKVQTKDAKCPVSPDAMAAMADKLNNLEVARDLVCCGEVDVQRSYSKKEKPQCWSVKAVPTSDAPASVQLASVPMDAESAAFLVTPNGDLSQLESDSQILVGVAELMTSDDARPTWLANYDVITGGVTSPNGFRFTKKLKHASLSLGCCIDYSQGDNVVVSFLTRDLVLARVLVRREGQDRALYATVTIQGKATSVNLAFQGVLYPYSQYDIDTDGLPVWVSADHELIKPVDDEKGTVFGRKVSMQSRYPLNMSLPYREFAVTAGSGPFPALALSTAWSDLRAFIGGSKQEISFDPVTGEVISNNDIVERVKPVTLGLEGVHSVGVGVVFPGPDVRQPMGTVVYFTLNSRLVYQQVFDTGVGGVFPAITFPTEGCEVKLLYDRYPLLEDHTMQAWADNMAANRKAQQARQDHAPPTAFANITSSFATGGGMASAFKPNGNDNTENKGEGKVVKDTGKIVERGSIVVSESGEAEVVTNGVKYKGLEKSTDEGGLKGTKENNTEGEAKQGQPSPAPSGPSRLSESDAIAAVAEGNASHSSPAPTARELENLDRGAGINYRAGEVDLVLGHQLAHTEDMRLDEGGPGLAVPDDSRPKTSPGLGADQRPVKSRLDAQDLDRADASRISISQGGDRAPPIGVPPIDLSAPAPPPSPGPPESLDTPSTIDTSHADHPGMVRLPAVSPLQGFESRLSGLLSPAGSAREGDALGDLPDRGLLLAAQQLLEERKKQNEETIKAMGEMEAKMCLKIINDDNPEEMSRYLAIIKSNKKIHGPPRSSRRHEDESRRVETPRSQLGKGGGPRPGLHRANTKSKACTIS